MKNRWWGGVETAQLPRASSASRAPSRLMPPKPAPQACPLHQLARTGDAEGVAAAVAADPECVTAVDSLQRTALHLAAWAGHAGVVRLLLEAKANVHAGACDNMLAIHFAAQNGHEAVCKELLKGGGKVNAADAKRANTALHTAVSKNHVATCTYLLKKNGNVKARNKAGKTPVELATTDEMRQLFAEAGRAKAGDAPEAKPEASAAPSAEAATAEAHSGAAKPAAPPSEAEAEPQVEAPGPQAAPPKSSLPPPQLGRMAAPQLGKMAPPQLGRMAPPQLPGGTAASLSSKKRATAAPIGGAKQPRHTGPAPSCARDDEEE